MGNVLLLSPTDSDQATFGASSQIGTLPVGNLQTVQPQKKFRTAGTTEWVSVQASAAAAWNACALVGHNLTGAATLRLRGAATAAGVTAAPAVDTGVVSAWPTTGKPNVPNWPNFLSLLTWPTPATPLQYWRLDIADAGNPDGYLEAGRFVIGTAWQPSYNFDLSGTPLALDQNDAQTKTSYGNIFTDRRAKSAARIFNVTISGTDANEVALGAFELQRLRGMWGDLICCLDPDATDKFHVFSMQGLSIAKSAYPQMAGYTANGVMFGMTINLNELL